MKKIQVLIEPMVPSKNLIPQVIHEQYEWRKTKQFAGNNWVVIADMQEPIWWNRPLKSETLTKQESDGVWSLNLPFIGGIDDFKTGYNLLLNVNSIPIATHIELKPEWKEDTIQAIKDMTSSAVYHSLIELGVNPNNLVRTKNDLLYKGKKFMGYEQRIVNGVFTENNVITLEYTPEEEIFKRLTGKYALTRGITGIIEETQCFTKQQFLDKLLEKIIAFTKTLK